MNERKDNLSPSQKDVLVFKYVQLSIHRHRGANGDTKTEMANIRSELGMTHKQIIREAERITVGTM